MPAPKAKPVCVLLVDDHELVRVGLRTILHNNQGMTVVGEAGSTAAAVRETKRLKPDIVLMDVRLPDGSGIEACRAILAGQPTARIIFLTSSEGDDSIMEIVRSGPHGYVLKTIDFSLLIRSIRAVSNGQTFIDPAIAQGRARSALAGEDVTNKETRPGCD